MTPEKFKKQCDDIVANHHGDAAHAKLDELVTELLTDLGYGDGMKVFLSAVRPCHNTEPPADVVEIAKRRAMTLRYDEGIPIRVIERDGIAIWSKVDECNKDLTLENGEGVLIHVRSVFVPHGGVNPLSAQPARDDGLELHPETAALVERFAVALKQKLAASERKYGWTNEWSKDDWQERAQKALVEHVEKGDPLDVAAFAAFLWHHNWPSALTAKDHTALLKRCREHGLEHVSNADPIAREEYNTLLSDIDQALATKEK